jgi:hypothetical protein
MVMVQLNKGKIFRIIAIGLFRLLRAVAIGVVIFSVWKYPVFKEIVRAQIAKFTLPSCHVIDEAGILSQYDLSKFNEYAHNIVVESDIDIRLLFVNGTGSKSIEHYALDMVRELGIGDKNREERGVLLLYDVKGKRLRVEVGYGLEEFFPDAFVGYLVHDHTRDFFSSGDTTTGLRLLIRMLHHRIREAILGKAFDPTVIEMIRNRGHLSGGAGVSATMPKRGDLDHWTSEFTEEERRYYTAQPTPEAAYNKYLDWLMGGKYDPNIDLFTEASKGYMESFPMTKAYFDFILIKKYGKKFRIAIDNGVALLYYTDDPLACPLFFKKSDRGWQMDVVAEVNHSENVVGGKYAWMYTGSGDIYTRTFIDKLVNIDNYIRIADGDNRALPIRGDI